MKRARGKGPKPARVTRVPVDWTPWWILAAVAALWVAETQGELLWHPSHWRHYSYLAQAFDHGQLHLVDRPNDAGDMAVVRDRIYVVFGPLPALPLMPLVALLGLDAPDVLVLALTALFAVFAFYRALEALHGSKERFVATCASLSLALGTAMHYGAALGNVWLHAQISAVALQCWALWMAASGRRWWCGVALGLAVLTRPTVVLAAPLAAWLLVKPPARPAPLRVATGWSRALLALSAPVALAAAVHAAYNRARFGSFGDAGYYYILMGDEFRQRVATFGRFSLHFLPHNLFGWLFALPHREGGTLFPDAHGMSLLLTVPFLWLILTPRRWSRTEVVAAATSLLIAAPALLYYNDGWTQFGQRFALDWIALGLLVASFGARSAPRWLVGGLTAFGIAVNAWGLAWFRASVSH